MSCKSCLPSLIFVYYVNYVSVDRVVFPRRYDLLGYATVNEYRLSSDENNLAFLT